MIMELLLVVPWYYIIIFISILRLSFTHPYNGATEQLATLSIVHDGHTTLLWYTSYWYTIYCFNMDFILF